MTSFRGGEMSVIEGLDGWLFIGEFEGIDALAVYTDTTSIPEPTYRTWASTLTRRRAYFADAGITYLNVVVPDSCVVYPDKLPVDMAVARPTPYERLSALLDDDVAADCVYPLTALIDGRRDADTYQLTDSHWTDWGAYVGYREVITALIARGVPVEMLPPERLSWTTRTSFGAMGAVMTPERSEQLSVAGIVDDATRRTRHVMTHVRDAYAVDEQDRPELPTAVVFRDSAMTAASKYFSQSFRRVVYVSSPNTVLYDLVEQERPDVVIHEFGERRIVNVPYEPSLHDFRAMFGDLLLDHPDAVANQRRARTLLAAGKLTESLAASDAALALAHPTARQMVYRSRLYRELGDAEARHEALRHAMTLDPSDAFVRFALAQALHESGQSARAVAVCEQAVELEPRQSAYWVEAITLAIHGDDPARAAEIADRAVQRFPDRADVHYAQSCALTAVDRLADAETAARRAIELAPDGHLYDRQLAIILVRRESWAEARTVLLELDRATPGKPELMSALAHVQRQLDIAG